MRYRELSHAQLAYKLRLAIALLKATSLAVGVSGCNVTEEREILLETGGQSILVSKLEGQAYSTVMVYVDKMPRGSLSILHTALERPLLFLSGREANELICVYDFDVGLHLLVFDTGVTTLEEAPEGELNLIVRSSAFPTRNGTRTDLETVVAAVQAATPSQLRQWSIPTARVGLLPIFASKRAVLERLGELERSHRGDGSPVIDG